MERTRELRLQGSEFKPSSWKISDHLRDFSAGSGVLLSHFEQGEGDVLSCGSQRYPKIGGNEFQAHSVMGKSVGDRGGRQNFVLSGIR